MVLKILNKTRYIWRIIVLIKHWVAELMDSVKGSPEAWIIAKSKSKHSKHLLIVSSSSVSDMLERKIYAKMTVLFLKIIV